MTKEANIVLRVDSETKQRIVDAARSAGKSITNFILEGTMRLVEKAEITTPKPSSRARGGACPSFFRSACATAKAGGESGYGVAAYQLTAALHTLAPLEVEDDEWHDRLSHLLTLVERAGTDEQIIEWFDTNLPRCLALVPSRRHFAFVCGVRKFAQDNEGLNF
jgi:hypothetical protein